MAAPTDANAPTVDSAAANPQTATELAEPRLAFPNTPFEAMLEITPEDAAEIGQIKANPHDLPYPLRRRKALPASNPVNSTGPKGRRLFDGNYYKDAHEIKEGRLYMGPEIDEGHIYLGGKTMSQLHEEMSNRHAMIMASYRLNLALHRNMKQEKRDERQKAGFVHAGFAVKKRMEEEREKARERKRMEEEREKETESKRMEAQEQ
ncbi:hypothetical protein BDZ89DRAFT_1070634, partial [Hymenopellis radicata]